MLEKAIFNLRKNYWLLHSLSSFSYSKGVSYSYSYCSKKCVLIILNITWYILLEVRYECYLCQENPHLTCFKGCSNVLQKMPHLEMRWINSIMARAILIWFIISHETYYEAIAYVLKASSNFTYLCSEIG